MLAARWFVNWFVRGNSRRGAGRDVAGFGAEEISDTPGAGRGILMDEGIDLRPCGACGRCGRKIGVLAS